MKVETGVPVYLWLGAMDMRVSFDRLSSFVHEKLEHSVLSGGIYVFFFTLPEPSKDLVLGSGRVCAVAEAVGGWNVPGGESRRCGGD